jgi:hypothetical protein
MNKPNNTIQYSIEEFTPTRQSSACPPIIFIVPYRDRESQLDFFKRHMAYIMEGIDHQILYIHQMDERSFNRGAIKNIGFLLVKEIYPTEYKHCTLVFNDIDTLPLTKGIFDYQTKPGTVKHFYGFTFCLGGIVSINAGDFEKTSGFPNLWTWGYEDNMMQKRVLQHGIKIDRSQFVPLHNKNIIHLGDGAFRNVNRSEFDRYMKKTNEGWHSIKSLQYNIDHNTGFVQVFTFDTGIQEDIKITTIYDLKKGNVPFKPSFKNGRGGQMKMFI